METGRHKSTFATKGNAYRSCARTGITLSKFARLGQQQQLHLAMAFKSVSGRAALEHVPSPLQTEIWTLVLRDVRRVLDVRTARVHRNLNRVCRQFRVWSRHFVCSSRLKTIVFQSIIAQLRLEEVTLDENNLDLLSKKIKSFSDQQKANPNFANRTVKITVTEYDPAYSDTGLESPIAGRRLARGLRYFSHLAIAELFSVSLNTILLLGGVCGHSLTSLMIGTIREKTSNQSDTHMSVSLPALRCLSVVGTQHHESGSQPYTDWSSMSIYAPSLTNLLLEDDSSAVNTIFPCLISGL